MQVLKFVIEEDEFIKLKKGEVIDKHWHINPLNPDYCLCVFLGTKKFSQSDFSDVLKKGHGVAPLTLTTEMIDRLQHKKEAICFQYTSDFEVMLVSHIFDEINENVRKGES